MVYAFVPTSNNSILAFTGTPGIATDRYALVWDNGTQSFTLGLPAVTGPDQFSGVLPVSKGGWGTNTGSFTSPGAITLTAGGTNQSISLNPSGTGQVVISRDLRINHPSSTNTQNQGIGVYKDDGFFFAGNNSLAVSEFAPYFMGKNNSAVLDFPSLSFNSIEGSGPTSGNNFGNQWFLCRNRTADGPITPGTKAILFSNWFTFILSMYAEGNCLFHANAESTSTTTGAVVINGGLGVVKNLNVGGNLRFSGGTVPTTATSAGTTGDIRYDGNYLYICAATNTWRRVALSTW